MEEAELAKLRAQAQSQVGETASTAVYQLGESGDCSPETLELLVDLVSSDVEWEDDESIGFGIYPRYFLFTDACRAIEKLGGPAIDALIARILSPVKPGDEYLLGNSSRIGRPLFELARILITDGDAQRAGGAESVVLQFVGELALEEVVRIYLAVCDRYRDAPKWMPDILRKLWPRLRDARGTIAEWWESRELRAWIEERIVRDPRVACMLLALLVVAPDQAMPVAAAILVPLSPEEREIAIESILAIDLERAGDIFEADPALWAWAESRAQDCKTRRDLAMVVACGRSPKVVESFLHSDMLRFVPDVVIEVLGALGPRAGVWRDRLARATGARPVEDPQTRAAIERVIAALPVG